MSWGPPWSCGLEAVIWWTLITLKPSATSKFGMFSAGRGGSPGKVTDDSLYRFHGFGVVCNIWEFSCIKVTHDG